MKTKRILTSLSAALFLLAAIAAGGKWLAGESEAGQSPDARAYQAAYALVLDEKWVEAAKALDAFLGQFPKSTWIDDARFWRCHVLEELDRPEEAFRCYQEFIKAYPESEWADDARSNLVSLGRELARSGKPEYASIIKTLGTAEEEEVAMAALRALRDIGDENAIQTLIGLYDPKASAKMRERIVSVLEDVEDVRAVRKLMDIAKTDPSTDVRRRAIGAVAEQKTPEAVRFLKELVQNDPSSEIRCEALDGLVETGDSQLIPYLTQIAAAGRDEDLVRSAIHGLGEIRGPAAVAALQQLFRELKSPDARREALSALADRRDGLTIPALRDLALSDPDEEIRRTAVGLISDRRKSPEAMETLKSILASSQNAEVKRSALHAIGDIGGAAAKDILLAEALSGQNPELATEAVSALAENTKVGRISLLLDVYRRAGNVKVREAAVDAISEHDEDQPAPVQTLIQLFREEKNAELRGEIASHLGETKSDDVVPVLLEAAQKDPDLHVRKEAVSALGEIGTPKAREALMQILRKKDGAAGD